MTKNTDAVTLGGKRYEVLPGPDKYSSEVGHRDPVDDNDMHYTMEVVLPASITTTKGIVGLLEGMRANFSTYGVLLDNDHLADLVRAEGPTSEHPARPWWVTYCRIVLDAHGDPYVRRSPDCWAGPGGTKGWAELGQVTPLVASTGEVLLPEDERDAIVDELADEIDGATKDEVPAILTDILLSHGVPDDYELDDEPPEVTDDLAIAA